MWGRVQRGEEIPQHNNTHGNIEDTSNNYKPEDQQWATLLRPTRNHTKGHVCTLCI